MTASDSQHLADLLAAQWHLMWPLAPAERVRRINEVREDMIFQMELDAVEQEMSI